MSASAPIVFAVDDSADPRLLKAWVRAITSADAPVHLVSAFRPPLFEIGTPTPAPSSWAGEAASRQQKVAALADAVMQEGYAVTPHVYAGGVAEVIRVVAQRVGAAMVVMGSGRAPGEGLRRSAVAELVRAGCGCPVLAIPREVEPNAFARVVVPLDGTRFAEQVLPHAASRAAGEDGELHLVRVIATTAGAPTPGKERPAWDRKGWLAEVARSHDKSRWDTAGAYLDEVGNRWNDAVPVTTALRAGPPLQTLTDYVNEVDADLIAITSHGRSIVERVFFGGVAAGLLHRTRRPVLILKPTA